MSYACRRTVATYVLVGVTLLLATGLAVAAPLEASAVVFELDPARSHVEFTLSAVWHTIHGTFRVKRGHLHLHPSSGAVNGECVVDATSGDSGNHSRDRKMHKEVLASDRYPEIVFSPVQVQGRVALQGESTVEVDGTFTIHGSSHPITTTAVVRIQGETFTFATHFLIPYVKWGMKDPSTFILTVDKQVDITFKAVGRLVR
jgi:polyisoprenoid-binding protein YceI